MAALDGSVWVTGYSDNTLVRVDGTTNTIAQTVKVGTSPCGIAVADGKLWVAVLGDRAVVEVDPTTGTVVRKIGVGGQGWDVQFGFGSIWVPIQGPDTVVRIDPASASIMATINGAGPLVSGLAVTGDQTGANQGGQTISRIDPATNQIVAAITLPASPFWFAVGEKSILVTLSNANQAVALNPETGEPGIRSRLGPSRAIPASSTAASGWRTRGAVTSRSSTRPVPASRAHSSSMARAAYSSPSKRSATAGCSITAAQPLTG